MAGFIQEFYYGNLNPQARSMRPGTPAAKFSKIISDTEAALNETLPETEKLLFQRTYVYRAPAGRSGAGA